MKKLLILNLIFVIFVLIQFTTVYALSPLHVDGRWIKNETDNIITLRGVNAAGFVDDPTGLWRCQGCGLWEGVHTWNPNAVKANLDNMSQTWGMNVLRLHNSIEWWKTDNSSYRQHIKDVITWAGERGMYVIYDTYCVKYYPICVQQYLPIPPYLNSTFGEDQVITSEQDFIDHWGSIAQELKDYPNVIFEIYNEPHGNDTVKEKYFNISQRIIDAIRSTGAEQLIIIQWDYGVWANLDYSPGSTMSWVENYSLNDPLNNLAYTTHLYRGNFHRTIGGRVDSWTYDEIKLGLQTCFVDYVINTLNKPVIIGEIGANMWWTGEELERELAFFNNSLSIFNEWNLSYIDWVWTTPSHMRTGILQNTIWIPPPNEAGQILINKIAEGAAVDIQKVKLTGKLKDKNNNVINANIILIQQGVIKATNQTGNGYYTLSVQPGIYDVQFNFTSIPNYYIKMNSVNLTSDRIDILNYINYSSQKISFMVDFNDSQKIETYSLSNPRRILNNGTEMSNASSLLGLRNNSWFFDSAGRKLSILVDKEPITQTIWSKEFMLQRFYSGYWYGAVFPGDPDYQYVGNGSHFHYSRKQLFTYLKPDGNLSLTDPYGNWTTISGTGYPCWGAPNYEEIEYYIRKTVTGNEGAVQQQNPNSYPQIPIMDIWIYNFEDVNKPEIDIFLKKISDYLKTLEAELGRPVWIILNPLWEFNQDYNNGTAGSGWGLGPCYIRGWNVPAYDYNTKIKLWVDSRNEQNLDNIVISSHINMWYVSDPTGLYHIDRYLEGFRYVDVLGASAYGTVAELESMWSYLFSIVEPKVGGNKPVFIFEHNNDGGCSIGANASYVNLTYSYVPLYPKIKGLSWWCAFQEDETTHQALVTQTSKWDGYSG